MKIIWTPSSISKLDEIYLFISKESKPAADNLIRKIRKMTNLLATFPESGIVGRVKNTREIVVLDSKYIISYTIKNDHIYILALKHSSQQKFN